MKYTIKLSNGLELKNLTKNGDNFVSKEEIDTSIFENNTKTITITDEEGQVEILRNAEFLQQMKLSDGYYICFIEKTEYELFKEDIESKFNQILDILKLIK